MDHNYHQLAERQHEIYRRLAQTTDLERAKLVEELRRIRAKMQVRTANGQRRHWSETPIDELSDTFRGRTATIPRGRFVQHVWYQDV